MEDILVSSAFFLCGALLAFVGLAFLALSQQKHAKNVLGRPDARVKKRFATGLGWAIIGLSFWPLILRDGVSFSVLLWPLVLGAAALAVAIMLTYWPTLLRPLAVTLPGSTNRALEL